MKSKITIVALHLHYGGVEKAIVELANYLVNYYDIELIVTYKFKDEPFKLSSQIKVKYLLHETPNKQEFISSLKSLKLFTTFKEGLRSLKILYLRKHLLIKELKTIKTDFLISTRAFHNKLVGKYAPQDIIKIAWEHNHHENSQKYIKKTINSLNNIDYFVLVSKELKDFYTPLVKSKCIYIPNSITISNNFSHKPESKLISVGRLSPEKGFLDLIDIFNEFNKINNNYTLTIIGDGPLKEALKDKIEKLNLTQKIILKGYLPPEKIHEELNTSKVYLMTSYTESFGIVLLEAMAHKIPCLAFSSAKGAKEIIKDNSNGYLISNRDYHKYIATLQELLTNDELYQKLSHQAYLTSLNFTSDKVQEKWLNLLASPKHICYNKKGEDE